MLTKTMIALATALTLGTASAALAANHKDRNDNGGYRVGSQGQSFPGANGAYAYAPGYRSSAQPERNSGESRFEQNWFGYQNCPGTEGGC
jgi:hypothetical protein